MALVAERTRSSILAPGQNHELLQRTDRFARIASEAASKADETGVIDPAVWQALFDSGLTMAAFDAAAGGTGLGVPEQQPTLCTILRRIGAADLSIARLFEGHANAIMLVLRYGTSAQLTSLAASVAEGGLTGVWGAEDAIGLRREPRGEEWSLQGRKVFASGAGLLRRPLITAGTPEGPVLYMLNLQPGRRADCGGWTPLGMKATASGNVNLSDIVVGRSEQIGEPGDFMRQPFFSGGAWRFCAAQLGAMERLTALYADQLRTRGRGSDPYQLERVAQCAAACGTGLLWIEEASRRFGDDSLDPKAVVAFTNLTRMVTERAALEVIECVQRGAGLGAFMRGNPIERIARDLTTYLRQPVPDLAMSDAARAVLAGEIAIGG